MFGAIAGAVGGIASGLLGSDAAKDASKAQAKVAKKQLKFSKEQWREMDALQKGLYEDQVEDIDRGYDRSTGLAGRERNALADYARDLRRTGLGGLADANDAIRRRNLGGFEANRGEISGARDASLRGLTSARDASLAGLAGARDASIRGLTNARDAGLANIWDARDESIAGFQPAMDLGNNALAAYGYNLGVGRAPSGYSGIEMTPGARFLMEQGVEDIQGSAAGRGALNSGATLQALEKYRQGLAATDRDNQMQQLFALGGVGQSAAGNIANLRTGAADDAVALRTGTAGDIAGLRTGAASGMASVRGQAAQNIADIRGTAADRLVANRNALTAGQNAADTALASGRYGIAGDYTDAMRGATTDYTGRQLALEAGRVADLGTARTNRANLYGSGAATYGQNALTAMANKGDAAAAGAVGQGNAWANAVNTGMGIWGATQGMQTPGWLSSLFNPGQVSGVVAPPMARPPGW